MKRVFRWFAAAALCLPVLAAPATSEARRRSEYTKTRYPIVLVPGVGGFDQLFGAMEYFSGMPEDLRAGGATVYAIELPAFNSIEERGELLLERLRTISAVSGAPKLNVIAHSQGGLDSRYAMAARPDLFASLTTVGSPHKGAPLADFLRDNTNEGGFTRAVLSTLANAVGTVLNLMAGQSQPQDSLGTLESLSTRGMTRFNELYPAGLPATRCGNGAQSHDGIRLYSWAGTAPFTNPLDPSDYAFGVASLISDEANDGLVGRCSAHFGSVIRDDYRLNHGDEINQVFGFGALFGPSPGSMFRTQVNRLKGIGL